MLDKVILNVAEGTLSQSKSKGISYTLICQAMGLPGLLFVNSKLTSLALSPEAFTDWYNDVHVPDVLKTSV